MRVALCLLLVACSSDTGGTAGDDVDDRPDGAAGADAADPPPPDAATTPDMGGTAGDDPGAPGPHTVTATNATVTTSLGSAGVTVYAPSGSGPFPLVVVSTGFQIGRGNYEGTCEHIASWGYVVVSHDYTSGNHDEKAGEVSELIDWALERDDVDGDTIAVAGHSLGGKVSILAAIEDPRIDAVVGWDPVDALPPFGNDGSSSVAPERIGELAAPLALLGETTDATGALGMACAPSEDNYQQFFAGACGASATLEVTIAGADHTDWVDSRQACGLACLVCATGTTADATVLAITRRVTVGWLEKHLRGTAGMDPYLASPGAPSTVRTDPGC